MHDLLFEFRKEKEKARLKRKRKNILFSDLKKKNVFVLIV